MQPAYAILLMMHSSRHDHYRIQLLHSDRRTLLRAAAHCLATEPGGVAATLQAIRHDIPTITQKPERTLKEGKNVSASVWHHGKHHELFVIGDESVLSACSLTENEREQLQLALRRADTYREEGIVVASGIVNSSPHTLPKGSLQCHGVIFLSARY